MADNGRLPTSDLAPIPSGELRKDAANAWNAPHGPADNGLRPTGSMSSYRTYDEQVYLYRLYQEGRGNLAAIPGTSNHGWGIAVDLAEPWMRSWIDEHGAAFGWRKTEAFSEWWHVNFVGGVGPFPPPFEPLEYGDRGNRVLKYSRRLRYIHRPSGKAYMRFARHKFTRGMRRAVRKFQEDHGLHVDGVIGIHTARRIDAVFHRQYQERS